MAGNEDLTPTRAELALYDDISRLAETLWSKSVGREGLNTDPEMFCCALFKRLWSNNQGFTLLWKNDFRVESDILLRSGIETAICISALYEMRDEFVLLMKQDAAATLQSQIKMYRADGVENMVRSTEEVLRRLQNGLPEGCKATRLDWKVLADIGRIPQLYFQHRHLSGVSSHVTGLSIMDGMGGDGLDQKREKLRKHTRKMHLMSMAGATLQGSLKHAGMIGERDEVALALVLTERMNALSWDWPGVTRPDGMSDREGRISEAAVDS